MGCKVANVCQLHSGGAVLLQADSCPVQWAHGVAHRVVHDPADQPQHAPLQPLRLTRRAAGRVPPLQMPGR